MESRTIKPNIIRENIGLKPSELQVSRPEKGISNTGAKDVSTAAADYGVNLSKEALDIAQARGKAFQIAMDTPPIRQEKVDAIAARIKSGEYQVDAENIANGLLNEAIRERLAEIPE